MPAAHYNVSHVRSRSPDHRRGTGRARGRHRGAEARARLPGAREGRPGQFDLQLPAADDLLHDARSARDRQAAVRHAVREADPARGAALLPARRRHLRPADRVRRGGAGDRTGRVRRRADLRRRDAQRPRRPSRTARPRRRLRDRLLRSPEPHRYSWRRRCRTSRTTTAIRTRSTASASSSSGARTRRRLPRSSSTARAPR